MTQDQIFPSALWVAGDPSHKQQLLRGSFSLSALPQSATLRITALGFFTCYLNGKTVSPDRFVPAWTDYERVEHSHEGRPITDEFRHRVYVMEYDVLPLLRTGKNILAISIGGGWYEKFYSAEPKACYVLQYTDANGTTHNIPSDTSLRWHPSYITGSRILRGETHDYNVIAKNWYAPDFDDSAWQNVQPVNAPEAALDIQHCPADRVIRTIIPKVVRKNKHYTVYDALENISGTAVIRTSAPKGEKIEVLYSEECDNAGELSFHTYNSWGGRQSNIFIADGSENLTAKAEFMWNGFRYFSVTNNAEPIFVEVIHSAVPVASSFKSDNAILNWLYDAYIRTQLANMHAGIPSDCPHREGRGYTGDGQLTCDCALLTLNAKTFYEKWLEDIYDCQDLTRGHVQYTAPYVHSGGGPGGWGGAIAIVPYVFYQHYGELSVLKKFFPRMELYFKYLEEHSENDLIVSDDPGLWCLGDWCTPDPITIPEPFVNTYFYCKTLEIYIATARLLGEEAKISAAEQTLARKKQAILANFFDSATGDFCQNIQGANAFAIDIGLGDERTLRSLVAHYSKTAMYNTGIFGTDIVTRILFEHGHAQLAFDLLTSREKVSFHSQIIQGATTLWEYWDGQKSRSHPMFGGVVRYLYYHLLGIRQEPGTTGFTNIRIAPVLVNGLHYCEGEVKGIYVKYIKTDRDITFTLRCPHPFTFTFASVTRSLPAGEHTIFYDL